VTNSTTRDPRRGNSLIGNYSSLGGGNPDLKPEQSETWNFGLILEPSWLKGFNLTLDYGFIGKVDAPTTMTLATLLTNEAFFPDRVVRGTPTAAEAALGWAGQINRVDLRRFNAGNIWTQYLDTNLRYRLETASAGSFYFLWRSTNTREFKTRLRLGIPITDTLDQIQSPLKFRSSGSVAWRYGQWTVTPAWTYFESYRDTLNVAVDNSLTFNLQLRYDVPAAAGPAGSRWKNLLQGTQWIVGLNNVLDGEPPYIANPGSGNFTSYYSNYDDPRGRYLYLRVRKTF
jgi:outer membrane receptor protein involved in Fe transport